MTADVDAVVERVAREHLWVRTLEKRGSDELDFYELPVWRLGHALKAAFEAGQASGVDGISRLQRALCVSNAKFALVAAGWFVTALAWLFGWSPWVASGVAVVVYAGVVALGVWRQRSR